MARAPQVTVKISDSLLQKLKTLDKKVCDEKMANEANGSVLSQIKKLIASGQSPVNGYGRFEDYKNPAKYPGGRKSARPVNLSLTGDMLDELLFKSADNNLKYGIHPDAANDIKIRARVHNTGERDDIPQRKFIPDADEGFTTSVSAKLRELFRKRILEILKG